MIPLAVIDVETTGLNPYRYDRVVEIGAVLLRPDQGISAEFTTLINPERDIGPTSIHGITASDVVHAPLFPQIAAQLADFLRNAVALAGHNIRFDISFLQSEYRRIGVEMPVYACLDTMRLASGGTLSVCCERHGVKHEGQGHCALDDARTTAALIQKLFLQSPALFNGNDFGECPSWPVLEIPAGKLFPREKVKDNLVSKPSYIKRLIARLSDESAGTSNPEGEKDYRALLWRVLEDGRLEESEADSLVEVAAQWGLGMNQIKAIHTDYLVRLARAAWADKTIADWERREIQVAAQLLGFGKLTDEKIQQLIKYADNPKHDTVSAVPFEDWNGKSVCFTGECICSINGQLISRDQAEQFVAGKGLKIARSVTKKLDLLVVADSNTESSKAIKARKYGIRILHEPVFWRSLGIQID